MTTDSRSRARRVAHETGRPVPRFDNADRSKSWHIRNWTRRELEYELAHQQAEGIHTWGPGQCGHNARGSGYCADCLRAEIERREGERGRG